MGALKKIFGFEHFTIHDGIAETNFTSAIADLPEPTEYAPFQKSADIAYRPFSPYPSISRDIALWVPQAVDASAVEALLNEHAGDLCVRTTLFDAFEKEGKRSYAFRLVFQSNEKTLTDETVHQIMDRIYQVVGERGFEVR